MIEAVIDSVLKTTNAITDLVGQNIFPMSLPDDINPPALTYAITGREVLSNNAAMRTQIIFASIGLTFIEAATIEKTLEDLFLDWQYSDEGFCVSSVNLLNVTSEDVFIEGRKRPIFVYFGEFSFMHTK